MEKTNIKVDISEIIQDKQNELDKYTMIHNNLSVNLTNVATKPRHSSAPFVGLGTELFGDLWFLTEKGEALYKSHINAVNNDQNIYAWNEIVCEELCKQVQIPCASYDFAHFNYKNSNSSYGIVSYNFLKPNEWLISSSSFFSNYIDSVYINHTYYNYVKILDLLPTQVYEFNKEEILFGLYKILIFDYLTSQIDRHLGNINFVCSLNEKSKIKLSLAPIFDNEMSFGIFSLKTYNEAINTTSPKDFCKYLYLCRYQASTPLNEYAPPVCNSIKPCIDPVWFEDEAKDIYRLSISNPKYEQYFKFILKNLNIRKCVESLQKKGYIISEEKINWYEKCIKTKKYFLNKVKNNYARNSVFAPEFKDSDYESQR